MAGFLVVFTAGAIALSGRRDVGAGLVPARPGPAATSPRLRSPLALAFRLHRGMLLAWTAGLATAGLVWGAVADGIGDLVADSPELEEIFVRVGGQAALTDAYLAAVMGILALIASGYAIQAGLRMRTEETSLRAELVLAAAVGRVRWAAGHLTLALLGPSLAVAAGGFTTGLAYGLTTGDLGRELPRVLGGGAAPRGMDARGGRGGSLRLASSPRSSELGRAGAVLLHRLARPRYSPRPVGHERLPVHHMPNLPGGDLSAGPLVSVAGIAIALTAAGWAGFRRRDLASG